MDSGASLRDASRTTPGLPGPMLPLSTRALPTHPGQSDACRRSLLPHRSQASAPSEAWPLPSVSRGRIGFACARARVFALVVLPRHVPSDLLPDRSVSRRRLPFDAGPELHVERAIHMADTSQSARRGWVNLAQPKATKNSRVGSGDKPLPLIEPDMQVSSIRLTDTRHLKARARC